VTASRKNWRSRRKQEIAHPQDTAEDSAPADEGESSHLRVSLACLPARRPMKSSRCMLTQVLETNGCVVQTVPVTSLADEMVDVVDQHTADVVCVSATRPAAVMHARHLLQATASSTPGGKADRGIVGRTSDLNKAQERIVCGASVIRPWRMLRKRFCCRTRLSWNQSKNKNP